MCSGNRKFTAWKGDKQIGKCSRSCLTIFGQNEKPDEELAFMMYPVYDVLLRPSPILNRHTLVGFLLDYEMYYSTIEGIHEQERIGNATISKTPELVPLENFIT